MNLITIDDQNRLNHCIENYAQPLSISNIIYRIFQFVLSLFGQSDWQFSRQLIENENELYTLIEEARHPSAVNAQCVPIENNTILLGKAHYHSTENEKNILVAEEVVVLPLAEEIVLPVVEDLNIGTVL